MGRWVSRNSPRAPVRVACVDPQQHSRVLFRTSEGSGTRQCENATVYTRSTTAKSTTGAKLRAVMEKVEG